jgi:hypothetical protein
MAYIHLDYIKSNVQVCSTVWVPVPMAAQFKAKVLAARLLESWVRIPPEA